MKHSNTRLLTGLGLLGLVFMGLILFQTWHWTREQIDQMTDQQARLAIEFDNAIRTYVADHVRPEMQKRVAKDEFVPEAMSTSFVARSVFDKVRAKYPEYILRFPTVNPRNPANRASAREREIIRYFERNPDKREWTGVLEVGQVRYLARAQPRALETECIQCHGRPEDAPASLVNRYGPTAGFGKTAGELSSIDLVGIPIDSAYALADAGAKHRLLTALIACALFVTGIAILIQTDIAHRRRAQQAMFASERRYRSMWESANEGFCLHEIVRDQSGRALDYRFIDVNPAFQHITGLSPDAVLGQLATRIYESDPPPYIDVYERVESTGAPECFECHYGQMDKHFHVSVFSPAPGQFATAFSDVSEQKRQEQKLSYQSTHDALTGLANRSCLEADLRACAETAAEEGGQPFALVFLDLDKFKMINDTLGHKMGDQMLVAVADRLKTCLRAGDMLARMGGDEFTLILTDSDDAGTIEAIAARILDALSRPFEIGDHRFVIGASMGIARCPADGTTATDLLKHADAAMYRAKQAGRGTFRWYSGDFDRDNQARVEIERDLRTACDNDQFAIHYQPIVRLADGGMHGAEALLRWEHPEKGLISPSLFIPVAEDIGLIRCIGQRVLKEACAQTKVWQDDGIGEFHVSVNISTSQIRDPGWMSTVKGALASSRLDPRHLTLELTETGFASDRGGLAGILLMASDLGVAIAIDDFGVEYSSLGRLKEFPVVHLKIDGSFVREIEHSRSDEALLRSIVNMAHSQGIKVTAEWVETLAQYEILRSSGCDYAQGYFISPALPAAEFHEFVINRANSAQREAA